MKRPRSLPSAETNVVETDSATPTAALDRDHALSELSTGNNPVDASVILSHRLEQLEARLSGFLGLYASAGAGLPTAQRLAILSETAGGTTSEQGLVFAYASLISGLAGVSFMETLSDPERVATRQLSSIFRTRGTVITVGKMATVPSSDTVAVKALKANERAGLIAALQTAESDIGVLALDLDGDEYWIWRDLNNLKPRLVVIRYNSLFGPNASVTFAEHYRPPRGEKMGGLSKYAWGASLASLAKLGVEKGFRLIGTNREGDRAFFASLDVDQKAFPSRSPSDVFVFGSKEKAASRAGDVVEVFKSFGADLRSV